MSERIRRIVCYAVNGSGLGHVSRLVAIARWLRRYVTVLEGRAPEIWFLTTSEATEVLHRAGFPAFKLPSKTVVRAAGLDVREYRRLARPFIWQTLTALSPDLLVVDTFPSGSLDELFQVLDGPFRKALVLREVKAEYAARPTYQAAMRLYDAVVMPHAQATSGAERPLRLPSGVQAVCGGEVLQIERFDVLTREEARARVGLQDPAGAPQTPLLYVSAGGGGDADAEATLSALVAALLAHTTAHLLVGAGPLYRGRRLGGPRITWHAEGDVARLLPGCDGAVAAAGYNTFHELMFLGVPTAFFPQERIADDQRARVARAVAAGACVMLDDPQDLQALTKCLAVVLAPDAARSLSAGARALVPDNGARRCAALLLAPGSDSAALARAEALLDDDLVAQLDRLPDRGAYALGPWLCAVLPEGAAGQAGALELLRGLLDGLSPAAADEVRAALSGSAEAEALAAFRAHWTALLRAARAHDLSAEAALGTVMLALKKSPLAQEPTRDRMAWVVQLLAGVTRIVDPDGAAGSAGVFGGAAATAGVDAQAPGAEVRLRIYRMLPRLVDADARTSLALAAELVRVPDREAAEQLMARIEALKLTQRRVELADLQALRSEGRK